MAIKTFRGKIVDGGQDTVVLHTNDGSTGYRIVKLQTIGARPGTAPSENIVKIYTVEQDTVDNEIDFSNNQLLAVAYYQDKDTPGYPASLNIIFDNMIFNQDIYITHKDQDGGESCNYYIELEQIKLDLNESTVATLKDIRNIKRTATG